MGYGAKWYGIKFKEMKGDERGWRVYGEEWKEIKGGERAIDGL